MNPNIRNIALSTTAVALAVSLAGPASAQSSTGAAATPDGSNTIVVPVFGVSMVVNLVTDSSGRFVSADITPVGPSAPAPQATITDPSTGTATPVPVDQPAVFEIKFDTGASTANVGVRLDDGSVPTVDLSVAADAGAAQWVGDPLGNGDIVVVGYTAGTNSAGALTMSINSVNGKTPADIGTVESAGEITWYQILAPTSTVGHVVQFITFFDSPADAATQVSTNLTFDVTSADSVNGVSVSLTDPNAAATINGTATPSRGEREGGDSKSGDSNGGEHESERDD